jgi:hypothetical protein
MLSCKWVSKARDTDSIQNDQFFISHQHQEEDGLPNLEDLGAEQPVLDDDASASSVVHTPPYRDSEKPQAVLLLCDVCLLLLYYD